MTLINKKILIYIIIGWFLLTIIEYYLLPYFIVPLLWLEFSFIFFIILIIEIIKLVKERKSLSGLRILKVIVFACLFYFTLNRWVINGLIEKIDWKIFYNKRMDIVKQVKENKLKPNDNGIYKLPFDFPILSNGENEIWIFQNKETNNVTVTFWIYRNFFNAPSTSFVYTNDTKEIKELEDEIKDDPKNNWKVQDNWYRTFGDE